MKLLHVLFALIVVCCCASCGGTASGGGLTITQKIELEAATSAAETLDGTWKYDNPSNATTAVGSTGVTVSNDLEITFDHSSGRFFTITMMTQDGVADNPDIVTASGSATYDKIGEKMTISATGTIRDSTPDQINFSMTITFSGLLLATFSDAEMYTFSSASMTIVYDNPAGADVVIVYEITPGTLPLMAPSAIQ